MPAADSAPQPASWWRALPISLAVVATVLTAGAAVRFAAHAGALWRDEAGTASFAAMASWSEIREHLQYDNFPPLLLVVLRAWNSLGFAGTDAGYRIFGLGVGLATVGGLWATSRGLHLRFPLWTMILFALNPLTVTSAGSLRPHGLGMLWLLATAGLMWRAITSGRLHWMVAATVAAVLCVQTIYTNALFLAALSAAALLVAWRQRAPAVAVRAVGIGTVAALSLLPHLPHLQRSQAWAMVMKAPVTPGTITSSLFEALAAGGFWNVPLCVGLLGWVLWRCGRMMERSGLARIDRAQGSAALFATGTFVLGTGLFLVFLQVFQVYPRTWYFVSLMALGALAADVTLAAGRPSPTLSRGLTGLAALALLLALPGVWHASGTRQTNVDQIAARLSAEARPGDFILVHPHYCGISFQRYYRGEANWTTLPPLADHRIHRYDLVKVELQKADPIQPVMMALGLTLQSGHRVWVVGHLPMPDAPPPEPRPAPANPWGWFDEPYSELWGAKAGHFLKTRAARRTVVIAPAPRGVNPFENLPLLALEGWQSRLPELRLAP